MTDPWADVRERNLWAAQSELELIAKKEITALLIDASALLAVVRDEMSRAYDEWLDLASREKAESFKDWLENVHPLLAALPKHLRGN